jgi:alpha-acetolactate decarboxylase
MNNKVCLGLAIGLLLSSVSAVSGCKPSTEADVCLPQTDKPYVLIYNSVDELLTGDLSDTVTLKDIAAPYSGEDIIGLGTTSRTHAGELLFIDGKCYWADPDNEGKMIELDWKSSETLPLCAVTQVSNQDELVFTGVAGNIHEWLMNKLTELGIPLAAIQIEGKFSDVDLSIASILPQNPNETLQATLLTVGEESEWQMGGFYALRSDDQAIISVPESPVHIHGRTIDDSNGGHIKHANSISSTVTIYPIKQFILINRVPAGQ